MEPHKHSRETLPTRATLDKCEITAAQTRKDEYAAFGKWYWPTVMGMPHRTPLSCKSAAEGYAKNGPWSQRL